MAANPSFTITPTELDGRTSTRAYSYAISPARSKLGMIVEIFKRLPRYHQVIIAMSIFALLILTGVFVANIGLDLGVYVSVLIPVIFTLLVELGRSIRDELRRKTAEELEETSS